MKYKRYIIFILLVFSSFFLQVSAKVDSPILLLADNVNDLCNSNNLKVPLKYIGWVLVVAKIIIPILIIVMGVIDFFKVITSSKAEDVPKASRSLAMRMIAGVVIFFIPVFIEFFFSLIDDWSDYKTSYSICTKCLFDPGSC